MLRNQQLDLKGAPDLIIVKPDASQLLDDVS
jgi:hypothetical protein